MTDPFLLTASTLPIAFTSDGTHAVPAPLWPAPTALQTPVIRQILIQNPIGNPIFYIAVGTFRYDRNRVPPSIEAKCRLRTEYMSGQHSLRTELDTTMRPER